MPCSASSARAARTCRSSPLPPAAGRAPGGASPLLPLPGVPADGVNPPAVVDAGIVSRPDLQAAQAEPARVGLTPDLARVEDLVGRDESVGPLAIGDQPVA